MTDMIKPPCGYMGDITPIYIHGRWLVTSDCEDYRAFERGEIQGFTWMELINLGIADTSYRCPENPNFQIILTPDNASLRERWRKYLLEQQGQLMTPDEVKQAEAVMKLPKWTSWV